MNQQQIVPTGAGRLQVDPDEYFKRERQPHDLPFRGNPFCIYFYYIGPHRVEDGYDDTGKPRLIHIRHYSKWKEYQGLNPQGFDRGDVEEIARDLAINAQNLSEIDQNPMPDGANLDHIVWTRKSYIVFLFDLDKTYLETGQELIFNPHNNSTPNHSFFDGWINKIDVSRARDGSQKRLAIFCINHMKKTQSGTGLGSGIERYEFRLGVKSLASNDRVYPDSGGTNMGPPVPP